LVPNVTAGLLALVGVACSIAGFALAYAPLRALRLDPATPQGREVRLIRLLGLALMAAGAYVTVTSLVIGQPVLPGPPPAPTPTLTLRML
jgi:hypothetical protein